MAEERGEGARVRVLIDKATNSTDSEVHPRLLKAIKSVVRCSDSELRVAAQTLMDLMKRDHSQVSFLFNFGLDSDVNFMFISTVLRRLDLFCCMCVNYCLNFVFDRLGTFFWSLPWNLIEVAFIDRVGNEKVLENCVISGPWVFINLLIKYGFFSTCFLPFDWLGYCSFYLIKVLDKQPFRLIFTMK